MKIIYKFVCMFEVRHKCWSWNIPWNADSPKCSSKSFGSSRFPSTAPKIQHAYINICANRQIYARKCCTGTIPSATQCKNLWIICGEKKNTCKIRKRSSVMFDVDLIAEMIKYTPPNLIDRYRSGWATKNGNRNNKQSVLSNPDRKRISEKRRTTQMKRTSTVCFGNSLVPSTSVA